MANRMLGKHLNVFLVLAFDPGDHLPPHVQLNFNVFLIDQKSGKHSMENRLLRFWFKSNVDPESQDFLASEFFKELVNPETFPRGKYSNFRIQEFFQISQN